MTSGIITACDKTAFDGLIWWSRSVKQWGYPCLCFDLGITQRQREIAVLEQIPMQSPPRHLPAFDAQRCFYWHKPFYIAASPFERTLWLDTDTLVIRSPDAIFAAMNKGPVVITEPTGNHLRANHSELYQLWPVPAPEADWDMGCNGGVIGLDLVRDKPTLDAWCEMVRECSINPTLRILVRNEDEGALMWAMLKTGHRTINRNSWNFPAEGLMCRFERRNQRSNTPDFLERVKADHNCGVIIHWHGVPKYWTHWDRTA